MATTYTGSAAGGPLGSAVQISIPQDGVETESVASVNVPMQKSADYLEALRQTNWFSWFMFVGNPGNAASTSYFAWAGPSQGAAATNPTAQANGQTRFFVGQFGITIKKMTIKTGQLTAGGTVTIVLRSGDDVDSVYNVSIPSGTAAGSIFSVSTSQGYGTPTVPDISVRIGNGAGVTASIGLSLISLVGTASFLGSP